MNRTRTYWLCQVAGWSVLGIALGIHPENWAPGEIQTTLLSWLLGTALGIGLTHAFRAYAKRHGWTRLPLKQLVPRGVTAAVVIGGLFTSFKLLFVALGPLGRVAHNRAEPSLAEGSIGNVLVVGAWIAIYFGVHAAWNYRQAEVDRWKLQARAEAARLDALKLQLNPHFFFNSLASVRSLISESPPRAKEVVARLARLLRKTLRASEEGTVPLREELSTTKTYLQLEKVRFEDRLEWTIDASEAAQSRSVPFMLVQTLAENAVKHGIGQRRGGGTIRVEAILDDASSESPEDALRLRVANPGQLEEGAGSTRRNSMGLDNARERLRLLYGANASLTLEQSSPETVTATARLPPSSEAFAEGSGEAEPMRHAPLPGEEQPQDARRSNGTPQTGADVSSLEPTTERPSAPPRERAKSGGLTDADDENVTRLLVGSPRYWVCQAGGWGALLIGAVLYAGLGQNTGWKTLLETALGTGVLVAPGVGLTHAFRMYVKWQNWSTLPPRRLLPRAIASAVLLGSTYVLVTSPLALDPADLPTAWAPWLWAVLDEMLPAALGFSIFMGIWIAIYFGVQAARKYQQAEIDRWKLQARAETARLDALKLQLNPHFFFNCLASVRALVSEEPGRAKKMVERLARLLRKTLQASDQKTVSLEEEISITRTYLELEKMRFEDRLGWTIDVGEAALQRQVPYMLVQTLVENAVKHGIGQHRAGGTIRVEADAESRASIEGEESPLRLRVTNPGELGEEAGAERGSGTGLENARERLQLLFGEEASLRLAQIKPETVAAIARIPRPSALDDRLARDGAASSGSTPVLRDTVPTGGGGP
ncbi:sensor histidine kinase [Salinibacter grassmerensis]|uniref:sensor histidine kinase n=1 Tax=Salinibacter grassmerensis TaxID=3040353 RepID=UPI0021E81719|nr:histidine kinase [Salinibacter grassmerensis]